MKRVLLVAHVFPPEPSPGSLRPGYLTRYLPRYGWEAVVLTHTAAPPPFPAQVVHAHGPLTAFLDRLPFRVRDALLLPDATSGWIPDAVRTGLALLRAQHFDAIFGTALPASVHAVCWALSAASGVPWLADYRDPWTGNAYLHRGPIRARIERALERLLLSRARGITTISDAVSATVGRCLERNDIHTIPNAYDPAEWETIPRAASGAFELVFTGSMYDGRRSPDVLFEALARLRQAGEAAGEARIHFYGPNSDFVSARAQHYGVANQVHVHGTVTREQAMRAQRAAAATLIFLSMESAGTAEMGSKFLEYLGARRPMLAFGPPANAMQTFLHEYDLGWFASDTAQAQAALRCAYKHFLAGSRDTTAQPEAFPTAPQLAQRFAARLDALAGRRQTTLDECSLEPAQGELEWR